MYTKENEGRNKGKEALDRGVEGERGKEGISPGQRHSSQPVFAMPWSQKYQRVSHVHWKEGKASFGRVASMQDLYIGRTGPADRTSSRPNLAAAAAASPPGAANRATASCLEQNGRSRVRIRLAKQVDGS